MADYKDIQYEVGANAVRITINRPEVMNAFRLQTVEELIDAGDDLEKEDYRRAMALIGEYLPVDELAGHQIDLKTLRQFGLVDSERFDHILLSTLSRSPILQTTEDAFKAQGESQEKLLQPHNSPFQINLDQTKGRLSSWQH